MDRLEEEIEDLNSSLELEKERSNKLEGHCEVLKGKLSIIKNQLECVRGLMDQLEEQDSNVTYTAKKRKSDRHRSPLNRDTFDI